MAMEQATARRLMVAAAIAGCALRLAFGLIYWNDKPLTHDEHEYLALAANVAAGRGLVYDEPIGTASGQQFGRAPGYPLFLAVIGAGRDDGHGTPLRVKIAQSVLGAQFKLMQHRGRVLPSTLAERVIATIHPSAVLRAPDPEGRRAAYDMLVEDLRVVAQTLTIDERRQSG